MNHLSICLVTATCLVAAAASSPTLGLDAAVDLSTKGSSALGGVGSGLANGASGLGGLANGVPGVGGLANGASGLGGLANGASGLGGLANGVPGIGGLANGVPDVGGLANGVPGVGGLANGVPGVGGLANGESGLGGLANGVPCVGGLANGVPDVGGLTNGVPGVGGLASGAGGLGVVGKLLSGLTRISGLSDGLISDVLRLNVPGSVDDVLNIASEAVFTVGNIIDSFIPGLGTYLSKLVVTLLRSVLCFAGSPGVTGNLLGYTPGVTDKLPLCTRDFTKTFGSSGKCSNVYDLSDQFGLSYPLDDVHNLANQYTNNGGVISGSVKVVFDVASELAQLLSGILGGRTKPDASLVSIVITDVAKVLGALGNSAGLDGDECVKLYVSGCGQFVPGLTDKLGGIQTSISGCAGDGAPWAQ